MNFVDPKEIDIPSHGTKNRYKTILPSKWVSPWFPTMTFSPALRTYCCENLAVFIFDRCVPIHKCIYSLCRKITKAQCCRTAKCRTLTGCLSRYTLWQHPHHVLKCSLGACWFSLEDSSGRWVERGLPCLAVAPPIWRMKGPRLLPPSQPTPSCSHWIPSGWVKLLGILSNIKWPRQKKASASYPFL